MRYNLEGLDASTRETVKALLQEIRELAERKTVVARRKKAKRQLQMQQKGWHVDKRKNEIRTLDRKIRVKRKRIEELTGQVCQEPTSDPPVAPTPEKRNQWIHILQGGAPGSGKRS